MRHSINDLIISTHALTEGDRQSVDPGQMAHISTHALTEGDSAGQCDLHLQQGISTHALTEGDRFRGRADTGSSISTHALTEGDWQAQYVIAWNTYFNSRPHGGRRTVDPYGPPSSPFQLTPSRRATRHPGGCIPVDPISTHALTEGDPWSMLRYQEPIYFNSRPHGGRLTAWQEAGVPVNFNSRPHGGRRVMGNIFAESGLFQLTPSRRATICRTCTILHLFHFNSRPHGGRLLLCSNFS